MEDPVVLSEDEDVFKDCLDDPVDWQEELQADWQEELQDFESDTAAGCSGEAAEQQEILDWLESIGCGAHAAAFAKARSFSTSASVRGAGPHIGVSSRFRSLAYEQHVLVDARELWSSLSHTVFYLEADCYSRLWVTCSYYYY